MRASTLLAAFVVALAATTVSALEFQRMPDPPCGSAVGMLANSSGLLSHCSGAFYYRVDGEDWKALRTGDDEWYAGPVNRYGISENLLIFAGEMWVYPERYTVPFVDRIDLASGDWISGSSCNPVQDYESCRYGAVIQSGHSVFVVHPTVSRSFSAVLDGSGSRVDPPLYRWIDDDEYCYWNCREGAPVSAAAQANGQTFAYGDIREYLGSPIGDFVRTEDGSWTDANMSHNGPVLTLFNYDGTIVAGGSFTALDGQSTAAAAKWTGSTWAPLVLELLDRPASTVSAFATHQGFLLFNAKMTVGERTIHQLWATDGRVAHLLDEEAPPGQVLATDSNLYIAGNGGLYRGVGTIVPTRVRSFADLKKLFAPPTGDSEQ